MSLDLHITHDGGVAFEDGEDRGRVLVSGSDTDGRYALMEYVAASRPAGCGSASEFGAHRHNGFEETFLIQSGTLRFLLGEEVIDLAPGDVVRVPAGTRHGYANVSGAPVVMLVSFHPGGFEQLFVRHRSDQGPPPSPLGFIEEAVANFASEFEDFPHLR